MRNDPQADSKLLKPREPSLPEGAYRLLHLIGAMEVDPKSFETLMELHQDIRNGHVDAAPSRLREMVVRVLHTANLSTLSENEMQAFLRECQEADM